MTYQDHPGDILVFKTDICEACDLEKIAQALGDDGRIRKWNVDRSDIDHVLRVQADSISSEEITQRVRRAGFHCEELTD